MRLNFIWGKNSNLIIWREHIIQKSDILSLKVNLLFLNWIKSVHLITNWINLS